MPDFDTERRIRRPGDALRVVLASLALLAFALLASRGRLSLFETDVFRLFNHLPRAAGLPFRVLMEAGTFAAVVVVTLAALLARRRQLALDLALSGSTAWLLARLGKLIVARARPDILLAGVSVRGTTATGPGFPSGHAAVAAALATVLSPYIGRRSRQLAWGVVWAVALGRVYVGAHLPLDVLGGVALGWLVGSLLHVVRGAPGHLVSPEQIRQTLQTMGVQVSDLGQARVDARGSSPMWAHQPGGPDLFVKLVSSEQRDADLLFKAYRFLAFRELEDESPFATPKQQVEHEAYPGLLAARAGVRVPHLVVAAEVPGGAAVLVEERIPGRGLSALSAAEMDDSLLRKIWEQVALLHGAHIAHRDLRRGNIVVDQQGQPWLIDFGFSEAAASTHRIGQDVAELLASLSFVVGPERAVRSASAALPPQELEAALPLLQPLALSSVTRSETRQAALRAIAAQVGALTSTPVPAPAPLSRVQPMAVLTLVGLALAVHFLLPQVGELRQTVAAFHNVQWDWLLLALAGAFSTYLAAALSLTAAVARPLALGRTALVQLAGSAVNRVTPRGLGGLSLLERYLERSGLDRPTAVSALGTAMAATSMVHVPLLLLSTALLGIGGVEAVHLPRHWPLLAGAAVSLAALGAALALRSQSARRLLQPVTTALRSLAGLAHSPRRLARLILGAAGQILVNAIALALCVRAFGVPTSFLRVLTVYLGGTAVSAASPTPGGLGAIEAALVAGLSAVGVPAGPAVAAVLAYRLLSFWLPILPGVAALRYLRKEQAV